MKNSSVVVIEGVMRKARVFGGELIVWKTDKALNKGDELVMHFPRAKTDDITERVEKVLGPGKGGSILLHVGTNNAEREGTTAIVKKYRQLVRTVKHARVEQIILTEILPLMGSRGQGHRNCRRMAINMLVQQLCREEEVGFRGCFVGRLTWS